MYAIQWQIYIFVMLLIAAAYVVLFYPCINRFLQGINNGRNLRFFRMLVVHTGGPIRECESEITPCHKSEIIRTMKASSLMNIHAMDTSREVKAGFRAKANSVKTLNPSLPYGYFEVVGR